jgi:hypothetical protein
MDFITDLPKSEGNTTVTVVVNRMTKYAHFCSLSRLLQPLAIPSQGWEELSMDFITGLSKSEGNTIIMVVVECLTKNAHFFSLSHPFKEITIVATFMETIQKIQGVPKIIVSDRDLIFTKIFWT